MPNIVWQGWNTLGGITGTLTAGTAQISESLDLSSGFLGAAISITVTFGTTISNGGVLVQILRDIDDSNNETLNSAPRQFTIPPTASTAVPKAFTVSAQIVNKFKIRLLMPTGNNNGTSVAVRYNLFKV